MTDTTHEAPERIIIESETGHATKYRSEDRKTWLVEPEDTPEYFYGEYVRADRIEELEAKLAKAVSFLDELRNEQCYDGYVLVELIKELKGQDDD